MKPFALVAGWRVVSVSDMLWGRRDIKSVQLKYTSMAKQIAKQAGVNASEAFGTAAMSYFTPIVEVDGVKIGDGKPGPLVTQLRKIYAAEVEAAAI